MRLLQLPHLVEKELSAKPVPGTNPPFSVLKPALFVHGVTTMLPQSGHGKLLVSGSLRLSHFKPVLASNNFLASSGAEYSNVVVEISGSTCLKGKGVA